jgi:hypothetical protein
VLLCVVTLNLNRQITGTLRGFDQFMNMVLDGAVDVKAKVDGRMRVGAVPRSYWVDVAWQSEEFTCLQCTLSELA